MSRSAAVLLATLSLLLAVAAPAGAQDWVDDSDIGVDPVPTVVPTITAPLPVPAPAVSAPALAPLVTTATVSGRRAMLRTDGRAAIPTGAPARVRAIIAAANQIIGKPYKWGGG